MLVLIHRYKSKTATIYSAPCNIAKQAMVMTSLFEGKGELGNYIHILHHALPQEDRYTVSAKMYLFIHHFLHTPCILKMKY